MFYLFEVRDSDGNDCDVFDVLVTADSRDAASEKLWAHLAKCYPNDENDGGFGTYHACDCACEHRKRVVCPKCRDRWECSHGGITTNEDCEGDYGPREFADYDAAYAERRVYHSFIEVA